MSGSVRRPDFVHRVRQLERDRRGRMQPITSWEVLRLQNGWAALGSATAAPAAYHKDSIGYVHLRGMVVPGQVGATLAELPDGYSPQYVARLLALGEGATVCHLEANTDGTLVVAAMSGTPAWISLDGATFRAAGG
jgi:hypothetical protein